MQPPDRELVKASQYLGVCMSKREVIKTSFRENFDTLMHPRRNVLHLLACVCLLPFVSIMDFTISHVTKNRKQNWY